MKGKYQDQKRGNERMDWLFDYHRWLKPGDTIIAADAVADSDFLWEVSAVVEDGDRVRLWVSGGLEITEHHITLSIATQQGRIKHDCLALRITHVPGEDDWTSPTFVNQWADQVFADARLGF